MSQDMLLEAREVRKAFGRTEALRGASLRVAASESVAVTGRSGGGKSTLLLCLAGILRPEAGDVTYDGHRLDGLSESERTRLRRREIGVVLQFGQLVPQLSVVANVALPLMLDRHARGPSFRSALGWLERLGALELAEAMPGELSGGEAQRVAVARALVTGPRVVLADEPTGALDTLSGEQVLAALLAGVRECRAALVMVTHDNRVAAHADREVVVADGRVHGDVASLEMTRR